MDRQCWYKKGEEWIAGIVVGETTIGTFFKKKMYLVEINKQSCFPPFEKWVERELMKHSDVVFDYLPNK